VTDVSTDVRAAFEQLFRATRTDLLAYILRRSKSAEDAADVLAETYLIAWQKLDAVPAGEEARLWLFGVARNRLLQSATRHRSRHALAERLANELRNAPPAAAVADEPSAALWEALAALPEREREVVLLTAWEGLTPKQIAAVTGTSANLVRVRLHRARSRLKRVLSARLPPAERDLSNSGPALSPSQSPPA
jgi:RNA polymerase sigma-70 factor (ECF subfamily)